MFTLFFVCFLAIISSFFKKGNLTIPFFILFTFLAIRYNYGNDYKSYQNIFDDAQRWPLGQTNQLYIEPGWTILNQLFGPLGFNGLIVFLSLIFCLTHFYLIKKYVPKKYYWLSIFLLVFTRELMLVNSSMLRNSFTISLFLIALQLLLNGKLILYLLLIYFATFFHNSAYAMFLVPFIFRGLNFNFTNVHGIVVLFLFILLYNMVGLIQPYVNIYLPLINENYEKYNSTNVESLQSGVTIYISIISLIIAVKMDQWLERDELFFNKLVIISIVIVPFSLIFSQALRLGQYFYPFQLVVIPSYMKVMKANGVSKLIRHLILIFYMVITFAFLYEFLTSEIWQESFSTYQTIFSN